MIFIAAIAAGFVAYGAPTNQDAHTAFTARMLEPLREAGAVLREPQVMMAPNFPSDVVLERCVRQEQRAVRLRSGAIERYNGYECIMEIWPNANPPYRTTGFYRHNGMEWEYWGPVQKVLIPSPAEFDPIKGDGRIETKPGALNYDGAPIRPFNEGYDPYQKLLDELDRYRGPTY